MKNQIAKTGHSNSASIVGMASCYALGNFADNFFKQAAILMAAALTVSGVESVRIFMFNISGKDLQSFATVLFTLPFIMFSAWSGWLADRVQKKSIVIGAKLMELCALSLGAAALISGWWPGILAVVFLMSLQSTIFNPALNGAIPESFEESRVPRVNSLIRLASTAAILAGVAVTGFFLDLRPGGILPDLGKLEGTAYGRGAAGLFIICISIIGVFTAFTLKKHLRAPAKRPFPWAGPFESLRHLMECRKDAQLFTVMTGDAFFYGLAAIALISIANLAKHLGYSDTLAGFLSASIMVGIAIGSLIAGRYPATAWRGLMVPALIVLGSCLMLCSLTQFIPAHMGIIPLRFVWFAASLLSAGIWGGIFIIPITSFVQIRPAAGEKGKVIGASNFYSFSSMGLCGAAFGIIGLLPPALTFVLYGLLCFVFALAWVRPRLAHMIWPEGATLKDRAFSLPGALAKAVLSLRYKVTEKGLDVIKSDIGSEKRPILFLPNHPALIDPILVFSRIAGLKPRALGDEARLGGPIERILVRALRIITIPDATKKGREGLEEIRQGLKRVTDALKSGDNVLLYPAGKIYRSRKEQLGGNSAVAAILSEAPQTRIVLIRSKGLWGSSFSYASGKSPHFFRVFLSKMPAILLNFILFMPRRRVEMEFSEAANLPVHDKMKLNHMLEDYYAAAELPAYSVPLYFWQGCTPVEISEQEKMEENDTGFGEIPQNIHEKTCAIVRECARLDKDYTLLPQQQLSAELGLDSLGLMELCTALEAEFGFPIPSLEPLLTVRDCCLAATGALFPPEEMNKGRSIPEAWFNLDGTTEGTMPLALPQNVNSLAQAFLAQVKAAPNQPLFAERSGIRTRKDALMAALVLSKHFAKMPGKRLGIMLPATPAASIAWLAAQLAGKETVMFNWTVGERNFRHCVELSGVSRIITAAALLEQLERQGTAPNPGDAEFVLLEKLGRKIRLTEKLAALTRTIIFITTDRGISTNKVPETAVILFTSGSEAAPKGVPLSQKNILSNAADVLTALGVQRRERLLAMLPPFHSFGFIVNVTLPFYAGLRAAFHPNPTESSALVFMVRDYKLTLMGATPTFLDSMLSRAHGHDDLSSLRFAFVGAEKCPEHLQGAFALRCPGASLCEGYGITECAPVISVNRPGVAVSGSIGAPLPSIETALIREDENGATLAKTGETGMLLVRGPNIFAGYLDSSVNPFVEFMGKRWYRTGDLIQQDERGTMFFKGRLSRFVKIAGEMISLPQMESILREALKTHPELPEDGKPFIAVESSPESENNGRPILAAFSTLEITAQEVNAMLKKSGLSLLYQVRNTIRLPQLPVLATGKIDYLALKGMLKENRPT